MKEQVVYLSRSELLDSIQEIGDIIYYEMSLKHQDKWLENMIKRGLYIPED